MKTIHYAIASNTYHKKQTLFISGIFLFFLVLLTGLLNLIDIEKLLFNQFSEFFSTKQVEKFQHTLIISYLVVLFFYCISIFLFIHFFLKSKKEDIIKWRLLGFSKSKIIRQLFMELFLPVTIVSICYCISILVFQHTYDFILVNFHQIFSKSIGIFRNLTLHAPTNHTAIQEMTPLSNSLDRIRFLDYGLEGLPLTYIFSAFVKNYFIQFTLLFGITGILANRFMIKSKKELGSD